MILDVTERVRSFTIFWHATFSPSGLKVILPCFRAKAIRLKAKVLDLAFGNKGWSCSESKYTACPRSRFLTLQIIRLC